MGLHTQVVFDAVRGEAKDMFAFSSLLFEVIFLGFEEVEHERYF